MPKMRHLRWFSNIVLSLRMCTVRVHMVKNSIVVVMILKWTFIDFWHKNNLHQHLHCKLLQITSYFNRGSGFQKSSSRAATAAFISVTSGARRGSYNNVDASYASAGISLAVTNPQTWPPNKICWFWHTLKIHLKYMLNTYFYRP